MLSPHKIHIHKAQLSSHKIHICNAQLSSQQIHIHKPQLSNQRYPTIDFQLLLFPGRCFIRCIQQRWTGLFGLYQRHEGWHQVFSFLFFLFSPFHCMLLFYLLIYFHPFIACFPLELCSRFLFFILCQPQTQIFFGFALSLPDFIGFDASSFFGFASFSAGCISFARQMEIFP